jgi:hypothetical protein
MSSGFTPNYLLPYPISTDPVNVSGDIEQLATKIDTDLAEIVQDTTASQWSGGTFSNGLLAPTYNESNGNFSMSMSQNVSASGSPSFVNITLSGNASINGGNLNTTQTTFNLLNNTATTLNIGGSANVISVGSSVSQINAAGDMNVASTKVYKINNTQVLSSTTLGSSVVNSSLTSVGTIATGTWNATTIAVNKGGTGVTSTPSNGQILIGNGSGYSLSTLTAGSNVSIINQEGSITINAAGGGGGGGGDIGLESVLMFAGM